MKTTSGSQDAGDFRRHLSDILSNKKGLSKVIVRMLAERFNVRQDVFHRPYRLVSQKPLERVS